MQTICGLQFELVERLSYSPDPVLSDYHVPSQLEKGLKGFNVEVIEAMELCTPDKNKILFKGLQA